MSSKSNPCESCSVHTSSKKRRIVVLGSTGSIGVQTLDVVRRHPDKLEIIGLAAGTRAKELLAQAQEFKVAHLALGARNNISAEVLEGLSEQVERASRSEVSGGSFSQGPDGVVDLCKIPEADLVVNALVGAAGLRASYETLKAGKVLALANKESLVVGGDLIMPLAQNPGDLMPIDSEHGAIYQCLLGENPKEVSKLWITASGGPFRGKKRADLERVTPAQALHHPTWNMGAKITIDSATLMNKGLELIEAVWLFGLPPEKIQIVVQRQSIVHSAVQFSDNSIIAQLGVPDMRIPIQYALTYPKRVPGVVPELDFTTLKLLTFDVADEETFRCLAACKKAIKKGGLGPCAANGANEEAVKLFLEDKIGFLDIGRLVEAVVDSDSFGGDYTLADVYECDRMARAFVQAHL